MRPRFLAERSGHHVQIEQPALVIAAIGDVLKTVQQKQLRPMGSASRNARDLQWPTITKKDEMIAPASS